MRIAIDFDGVIHEFAQGFKTASVTDGGVVPGALEFVNEAIAAGHKLMIFSGRACGPSNDNADLPVDDGGKAAIERFLADHGFPALSVHCRKPHADLFIDDLGWRFEGEFPAIDQLEEIAKPWYRRNAMGGLATGNRKGKSKGRAQDILTPQSIVDFVREVFGGEIMLDPCATSDERGLVNAVTEYRGGPNHIDGLLAPWGDHTYCNPPYRELKKWLSKARTEAWPNDWRIAVLCPVRSNRTWWREARDSTSVYIELNPVTFVGYDNALPVPMCLMLWNVHIVDVGNALALHPLGVSG
jgi:hypothetical protein